MSSSAYRLKGTSSELTLVGVSAHSAAQTFLTFSHADLRDTLVLSSDGDVMYAVETDVDTRLCTRIFRGQERAIVAEAKRKDLRADRIKFGDASSVELKSWLHGASGKCSDFPASFEWKGKNYTWKTDETRRQIVLYHSVDLTVPIAYFQASRREIIDGTTVACQASLAFDREARGILDAIIVSLVIVEGSLRRKEAEYQKAQAIAMVHHV